MSIGQTIADLELISGTLESADLQSDLPAAVGRPNGPAPVDALPDFPGEYMARRKVPGEIISIVNAAGIDVAE